MNLDDISPDLIEKAKACSSTEELLTLAKQEGIQLSDKELDGVAGGWDYPVCETHKQEYCDQDDDGPE